MKFLHSFRFKKGDQTKEAPKTLFYKIKDGILKYI